MSTLDLLRSMSASLKAAYSISKARDKRGPKSFTAVADVLDVAVAEIEFLRSDSLIDEFLSVIHEVDALEDSFVVELLTAMLLDAEKNQDAPRAIAIKARIERYTKPEEGSDG